MKYCSKCGKELFDEAVICPGCGCPTEVLHSPIAAKPSKKPLSKKKKAIIGIAIAFAVVLLIALLLFAPRSLKLASFTTKPNAIQALIVFGIPDSISGNEWIYRDRIEINGNKIDKLYIDMSEGTYSFFQYDYDLYDDIDRTCNWDRSIGAYDEYTYKGATIITDGFWFNIEVD